MRNLLLYILLLFAAAISAQKQTVYANKIYVNGKLINKVSDDPTTISNEETATLPSAAAVKEAIDGSEAVGWGDHAEAGYTKRVQLQDGSKEYTLDSTVLLSDLYALEKQGDVNILNQNRIVSGQVTVPTGYTNPLLDFDIFREGERFTTSIDNLDDFREKYMVKGSPAYVGGIYGGSNSNGGTSTTDKLLTIEYAWKNTTADVFFLEGGQIYDRLGAGGSAGNWYGGASSKAPPRSMSIIGFNGRPQIGAIIEQLDYTQNGTYPNVWETTRTNVEWVLDQNSLHPEGFPLPMREASSLEDLALFRGYTYDGTTLRINVGGASPTASDVLLVFVGTVQTVNSNADTVYMENLDVFGKVIAISSNSDAVLIARNCRFLYSEKDADGIDVDGANAIFHTVTQAYCGLDGLNYHDEPGNLSNAVEINCLLTDPGQDEVDGPNQNSTMHDGGAVLRINGKYNNGYRQSIADVNTGGLSWNLGCELTGKAGSAVTTSQITVSAGTMWIEKIKLRGSGYTYDVGATSDGTLYILDTETSAPNQNAEIKYYAY